MSTTTRRTRRPTARLLGCGLLLAVASAACSTDPGKDAGAPATPPADVVGEPAVPAGGSTVATCPDPEGGLCLGDLDPGTYRTQVFTPGITYTVPSGWTNGEDLPGNFLLHRREDSQEGVRGGSYLGIYQSVRAAAINCDEARQAGVGATPVELVRWYRSVPGLAVSPATEVEVGGLRGLQIDLSLDPGKQVCRYGPYQGVPLIIGNGTSQLHHVILKRMAVRLVILQWRRGNVTLEVTSVDSQHTATEFRALLRPVIDSLRFRA